MDTRPMAVLPPSDAEPASTERAPRRRRLRLRPGWPVTAILLLYPLWWALGLGVLIWIIMAIPMGLYLMRKPTVRLPPGFGIWALYLVWVVVSMVMIGINPPGTVPDTVFGRLGPTLFRVVEYFSVTILLLYVGNLTEAQYPRWRIVRQLAVLFLWTVIGGVCAIIMPRFQFTSPLEMLLPTGMRQNPFIVSIVHPAFAQLQEVLGYEAPRPAAPFGYTNLWGNCLGILLPWFIASWLLMGSGRRRLVGILVLLGSLAPIAYSLNRGLWIGLLLSVLYVVVRLIVRGRTLALAGLAGATALLIAIVALSPLHAVITARLDNGHSNSVRAFSISEAVRISKLSPILGYGTTRNAVGGPQSAAVGKTLECPRCGNIALGSNGQFWLVLVATGFVGAALYVGYFVHALWYYRRDSTTIGVAGVLAVGIQLFFMFVYSALIAPLALYMISMALLWRNNQFHEEEAALEKAAVTKPRLMAAL